MSLNEGVGADVDMVSAQKLVLGGIEARHKQYTYIHWLVVGGWSD